ncbi:CoA ester lyase [Neisseria weixii]|uniref:CoA ester lyase n=1 Tax=Neisseria weixii TaxID=1853276 RepID=A0A3N4MVU2_9NEIS|nr:CoA ester lyase [Neisseria weixii]RPD83309.1 CoA ester lyase [Neisseria weixii]RPD83724.1 CoA ester lyase [Neisseria weixii]
MLHRPVPKIFLFVPATRPERIAKAFDCGADEVIVDWEDTVEPERKAAARADTEDYCGRADTPEVWVRINGTHGPFHTDDVAAAKSIRKIKGLVLPKTVRADEISSLHHATGKPVIADIESAQGMAGIGQLARSDGLFAMTYGCLDLSNDLGVSYGTAAAQTIFDRLRTDMLLHSRINHLHPPIETTFPDFNDHEANRRHAEYWRDMGFGGVLCIHPKQVAAVKEALRPSENLLAFAAKVVAEAEHSGQAVFQVDGQMIDAPVIERAKWILQQN